MRAWAIKLGSGGSCVPFCERHGIVGLGWRDVDATIAASATRPALKKHVGEVCAWYHGNSRKIGMAASQLARFARECAIGDLVLYYDPPRKHVQITRVTSGPSYRDFEREDDVDIWHFRRSAVVATIPILDFYGGLKWSLLGPKLSFWELRDAAAVEMLSRGEHPHLSRAPDPELKAALDTLKDVLMQRAEALDEGDWEELVADYFVAQGAHVDHRRVGGSHAVIDVEARFDHGELGEELWRVQVKRLKNDKVDWPAIEKDCENVGEARFCFVSVFGFTEEARRRAYEERVHLLEATDFARFLLSGKLRPKLLEKLRLPFGAY